MKFITNQCNNKFYFRTETSKIKKTTFSLRYFTLYPVLPAVQKNAERIYSNSALNNSNLEPLSLSKHNGTVKERQAAVILKRQSF